MQNLLAFDRLITKSLQLSTPSFNKIETILSLFFSIYGWSWVLWAGILGVIFWKKRSILKPLFTQLAYSLIPTFVIVEYLIKNLVGRVRPWQAMEEIQLYCPGDYSFPSSHAALAFAAATIFANHDRKNRFWYYLTAALISYSRIYLHCHYLGDVLVGGFIGWLIALLWAKIQIPKHT